MLCIPIKGPTYPDAIKQIEQALTWSHLVELRLDQFSEFDLDKLQSLLSHFSEAHFVFTLRSSSQGGGFSGSEEDRLEKIEALAALQPHYLDLEYNVPVSFFEKIHHSFPSIKIIASYHDFLRIGDLEAIVQQLCQLPTSYYKIATLADSSSEVLSSMLTMKNAPKLGMIMNMGQVGSLSRILAPIYGSPFVYASLDSTLATAPGQLSAQELVKVYHHQDLNAQTAVFGLIGTEVGISPSHLSHNALLSHFHLNGVYVKFPVYQGQLKGFLDKARQLGIRGLSVTMPWKEEVLKYLDEITPEAKSIGAVNTLFLDQGKLKGYNTDGIGALNALEKRAKITDQKVVIIGAGGSARAIAFEAKRRGADVLIINRTDEKAFKLAQELDCQGGGLEQMTAAFQTGYDVLINTTPHQLPIDPSLIIPYSTVMDILLQPTHTLLIQEALKKECQIVYGWEMFFNQAIAQFEIWFGGQIPIDQLREGLKAEVLKALQVEKA